MTRRRSIPRSTPRTRTFRACALGAAALAAAALPSSAAAAPGSGTGTWAWVLAAIGAAVLLFALYRLRAGGRGMSLSDIADGRQILVARGRRVTEELTSLADVVSERDDEAITRQHQRALDVVAAVRSRVSRTSGQRVQAKAHHDLDEAEWLIAGLRARLDGFVEPLQQRNGLPATCFFDGCHGLATVDIDLGGIALQRVPVRTCAACAVGLVRGERPHIGSVELGGRPVPWPAAPRWCGSYGWALKDLKHLHYDGEPIFLEPERPRGRRRQTVAERARGVRSRVLPVAPTLLPEDLPGFDDDLDLDPHAASESEILHEERNEQAAMSNAFAAMESEAPVSAESEPASPRDAQPE